MPPENPGRFGEFAGGTSTLISVVSPAFGFVIVSVVPSSITANVSSASASDRPRPLTVAPPVSVNR